MVRRYFNNAFSCSGIIRIYPKKQGGPFWRNICWTDKHSGKNRGLAYGKGLTPPIPGGTRPGLIFFNDEGTENGGLVFMGHKDATGKYSATGHLSFDQYNQNQVLYLQYADDNGQQTTGLHIDDWQTSPPFWQWRAGYKKAQALPEGAEKDALLKKLMEPQPGKKAVA